MGNIHSCIRYLSRVLEVKINIHYSQRHWSLLAKPASNLSFNFWDVLAAFLSQSGPIPDEEEAAENMNFFETLQRDRTWGSFFQRFDKDELVVGRKFREGAQGELYEARIKRDAPVWRQEVKEHPDRKYVLKVFKFGTPLRNLKKQWPEGYLRFQAQRLAEQHSRRYNCDVICGTLLEDVRFKGRFAFLLQREEEDLRSLIDRNMRRWTIWSPWTIFRRPQPLGPFPKEVAESIMYEIACGVDWLHRHDIVHRDLKAANVLVSKGTDDKLNCFVADYECSVGVCGTTFFRAPEIFRAQTQAHNGDIFTKAVDAYGYGMICFEILTGKLPFADHSFADARDRVLSGHCLELPTDVDKWMSDLLMRCWHSDPEMRPSFGEILKTISDHSTSIRGNRTMNKEFEGVKHKPKWCQLTLRISMLIELEEYLSCTSDSLTIEPWSFWSCTSDTLTLRIQEQIEMSKSHWSELDSLSYEGQITTENLQLFQELQMDPLWGYILWTFGDGVDDSGHLVIREKFAEGGQAELFHAHVSWNGQVHSEVMLRILRESKYVLKVFKKGTSLRDLLSQMPHGMLESFKERAMSAQTGNIYEWKLWNTSNIICGTLLEDGRFAYLMERESIDLRSLIDQRAMMTSEDQFRGPFAKAAAERMIYDIALGMSQLHSYDIIHRDLKASNILVRVSEDDNYECFVADFESSIGVIGTGFFRAPEILEACREKNVSKRPELFTQAADIYSYGMLCYEILTGELPFEDNPFSDDKQILTDSIINQHLRPEIPDFVDDWICGLLKWCWQSDPGSRPSAQEILDLLERNMS
ncbi:hypothetical protein M758_5G050000 [Ceratodon purpureus]|nr:hypothetical protein M758_5G050000 [Ceratodon purpureus]